MKISYLFEKDENLLDPQEVEANYRGEITASQKKRFYRELLTKLIDSLEPTVFLSIHAWVFLSFSIKFSQWFHVLILPPVSISILYLVYSIFKSLIKYIEFESDCQNHALCKKQSQVLFEQRYLYYEYVLRTHTHTFYPSHKMINHFTPGMIYDLIYLKKSKFLLSAQLSKLTPAHSENANIPPEPVRIAINQALSMALGFSPEELAANRNGKVSKSQQNGLFLNVDFFYGRPLWNRPKDRKLFIVSACIVGIPLVLINIAMGNLNVLIPLIIIAMIISLIFVSTRKYISIVSVQQVEGIGKKIISSRSFQRVRTYSYKIGVKEFIINYDAYIAFIDGLPYRAYYILGKRNQ